MDSGAVRELWLICHTHSNKLLVTSLKINITLRIIILIPVSQLTQKNSAILCGSLVHLFFSIMH